jgi:hypothetical protein
LKKKLLIYVIYYIASPGELYAWGMGDNGQLGSGEESDLDVPTRMM